MKEFLKKNWTLIIVLLYFIAPDLIPGLFDDVGLLVVERILHSFFSKRTEQEK
ncbi:hypothetical protein JW766_06080 [Candidatus Dojkabacteria bacterium]|nr:hypothetical protein [Candidatus Dojkabacteria bacterium]